MKPELFDEKASQEEEEGRLDLSGRVSPRYKSTAKTDASEVWSDVWSGDDPGRQRLRGTTAGGTGKCDVVATMT